jgi:hypothetical protein
MKKPNKWDIIVIGFIFIVFIIGFVFGFFICDKIRVAPLEKFINDAEKEKKELENEIEKITKEKEEEIREAIENMDPDTVIDNYLNNDVLVELTEGTDKYTREIVKSVFEWLREIIRKNKTNSS